MGSIKSDQEILEMAIRDINDHLIAKQRWRNNYVKQAFSIYDGDQWEDTEYTKQINREMPVRTINKAASVIDAVSGFEVQNRSDIDCLPLSINPDPKFIETANNGTKWCESTSGFDYESSEAFKDLLKCGLGCTANYISYMSDPDGITKTERIFPLLALFDPAARKKNLKDKRWCGFAEIVEADSATAEAGIPEGEVIGTGVDDRLLLDHYDTLETITNLIVRYEYQWREVETFWRVKNTLLDAINQNAQANPQQAQLIGNYLIEISNKYGFDPKSNVFSIKSSDYNDLKRGFEVFNVELKAAKQKRFNFFRAKILGDRVIEKGLCIRTDDFDINFMTGKFSEKHQSHYGMIHGMIDAQRMLNQTISDFEGYLKTIPKGGVIIEATATPDIKEFIDTYAKANEVTVVGDGAISQGRIQPKQGGALPQGIPEMIALMLRLIPEIPGVTPDFMGIYDGNQEVSGILQAQRIRQGLTVLATYFDAKQQYTIEQGKFYLDSLRVLAENAPGRLIRNVLGEGGEKFLTLSPDSLASEYVVEVRQMAQTPNEQQEMFTKLVELGTVLEQSQKTMAGIATILPIALDYSSIKEVDKQKIAAALTPQPAPQPDPINQALIVAETNYKNSMAMKNTADSKSKDIENLIKIQELKAFDENTNVDQILKMSQAELNAKKADSTLSNVKF